MLVLLVSVVCNNVIAGARIIDKLSQLHLFVQSKELCRGDMGSYGGIMRQ